MKYVDEFRDPVLIRQAAAEVRRLADPSRHYRIMEVCGGHTHAIYRFGLEDLLPPNLELIHGPGCPVCVLPMGRVDNGLDLTADPAVLLTTFGDVLRVPGRRSGHDRAAGARARNRAGRGLPTLRPSTGARARPGRLGAERRPRRRGARRGAGARRPGVPDGAARAGARGRAHHRPARVEDAPLAGLTTFAIRASGVAGRPTVHVSPDLAVCAACLDELSQAHDARRAGYPYINCTECGPRYSIVLGLPYDRHLTTMADWPMCAACAHEYHDPGDRRFHAQPTACWACGPSYALISADGPVGCGRDAIEGAAGLLAHGAIVAVKGLGGYHLACDAADAAAVARLRERKFRKEKPFALMVRDPTAARRLVRCSPDAEALLQSTARPIVLAPALVTLGEVAPDTSELGVMLPYTPLHHLLFAAGAPDVLVMTSGNRSNEPIAFDDEDARVRLSGIADAFLVGERRIARRVEDSVVRDAPGGPVVLRRSRGYAPAAVARIPSLRPILAVGADLKNTVTLVVDHQAFASPHLGDLDDHAAATAFDEAIGDLLGVYALAPRDLVVAHDRHPQYVSTRRAEVIGGGHLVPVQHHVAHVASVIAERAAWDTRVVGVACDGTGYGEDGAIWGGELFVGSVAGGFVRAAHLREAALVGGDAAARDPVQASAGFLAALDGLPPLEAPPFAYPDRYARSVRLLERHVRTFRTTSVGRLFDCAAALLGFTRQVWELS